ncbi:ShlB/FhaC/HecB family hemolysin secretion/activation protein [Niveispirillum sp. BGYR6]|uniref:ShlB/FhaC/HecB family hemolysin secretion/activation protein n=1 Tax=Niveispirillum sp. BGYR6 TaxID=2971249 RepID=UPI0022B94151|nr:ShlB/FhaC/HecB family hemolysin secretion/activation protein [Niveispirillum sp. BGYR6]MDG5496096.1 ShlB/FhaC/HecB family hemolysin secretion/activation protein [Niveispirillum sp. BGYR6]
MKKIAERTLLGRRYRKGASVIALETAALFLTLSAVTLPAQAQQVQPTLPTGAEPGRGLPQPVLPTPSAPGQAIAVPRASAAEAPAGAENFKLVLNSVLVEGNTAFDTESLRPLYAGLIGKEVTVRDLFTVANEIELRYRNAGYVTSRVIVPEQTIEDGSFRISVVEGSISDIVYADDIGPARDTVERLLEPLRGIKPINIAAIERRLLLANDLPGMTVRGSLEPSPTVLGGSVIVVKAERKLIDASLIYDNRNSPYLGSSELIASVSANSIASHADRVGLTAKMSTPARRSWTVAGNYQATLGSNGLTVGLVSSYASSSPGRELKPLEIDSEVVAEVATIAYPLIRSRLENLRLVGEFEYRNVKTDLSDKAFNEDRLRILRAGLSYDRSDSWDGITAARITLHQGLDVLGATDHKAPLASRAAGHTEYLKVTADLTRVQQLPNNFSVLATLTSQFTKTPLLASEEIALGGPNFGRAYNEGEISGDNGWAGSLELRYSPALAILPQGVQFYAFYDGGQVWSLSNTRPSGHVTLASTGGGVRANLHENLFATLEVNKPLNLDVATEKGKPTRVFFSLTAHY